MQKNKQYTVVAKSVNYWALGPGQGIAFGHSAITLTVGEVYNPMTKVITEAQLAQLKADPGLVVVEGAALALSDDTVRQLKADLEAALSDNKTLKAQNAGLQAQLDDLAKEQNKSKK